MQDTKVLILGSTGLLGTALVETVERDGFDCLGLSHGDIEITDNAQLLRVYSSYCPDIIINTVAVVGVDPCEEDPIQAYKTNTLAAYWLARLAKDKNVILVQVSTVEVFDGRKKQPYVESDSPNPLNLYGLTKSMAEVLVRNYCDKHYIVRLPAMFGARRNSRSGYADKVHEWIKSTKALRVVDDRFDSPSYSLDIAEGLMGILIRSDPYGTYHLANEGDVSLYEFVMEMASIRGKSLDLSRAKAAEFPARARKLSYAVLGSEKSPLLRDWRQALRDYLQDSWERRGHGTQKGGSGS